jgi:hypothetical protein
LPLDDILHLKSDTLWSYEVGSKIQVPQTGLLLSVAAFHIDWKNLQQQVALPCGFYLQFERRRSADQRRRDRTLGPAHAVMATPIRLRL